MNWIDGSNTLVRYSSRWERSFHGGSHLCIQPSRSLDEDCTIRVLKKKGYDDMV